MSDSTLIRKQKGMREFKWILAFALALLVAYTALYEYELFPEFWSNLFSNFLMILAAGFSAFFATLIFIRYEPADAPRPIWMLLAIGLWLWTIAESIWTVYNTLYIEVGITYADICWVVAYFLFAGAVFLQYRLVFHHTQRQDILWLSLWAVCTLLLTGLIAWVLVVFVEEEYGLPLWIASFYPAADFAIGLAALNIVRHFRQGALGYPWLGLLLFAIADMNYAFLELGGFYTWSVIAGNRWSMIADITYVSAYLFVGIGCVAQCFLLRYGPIYKNTRLSRN
jgi:hypothetical protein